MVPPDIYRICHPNTIGFTFFSAAHGTFTKLDHILGCTQKKVSANAEKLKEFFAFCLKSLFVCWNYSMTLYIVSLFYKVQ